MVSPKLFAVALSLLSLPLVSPLGSSPPLCPTFRCHCCLYQLMSSHHPLHLLPGPVTIATKSVIQERNHYNILLQIHVWFLFFSQKVTWDQVLTFKLAEQYCYNRRHTEQRELWYNKFTPTVPVYWLYCSDIPYHLHCIYIVFIFSVYFPKCLHWKYASSISLDTLS